MGMNIDGLSRDEFIALVRKLADREIPFAFDQPGTIWVPDDYSKRAKGCLKKVRRKLAEKEQVPMEVEKGPEIEEYDKGSIYWGAVAFPGDGKMAEAVIKLIDARMSHWLERMNRQ